MHLPTSPMLEEYDHVEYDSDYGGSYPTSPDAHATQMRSDDEDWEDEDNFATQHSTANNNKQQGGAYRQAPQVVTANARPHTSSPRKRRKASSRATSRGPTSSTKPLSSAFQWQAPTAGPPPVPHSEPQREWRSTITNSNTTTPAATSPPADVPTPVAAPPLELPRKEEVLNHVVTAVKWSMEYAFSIVRPAVRFLRYPLSFILFLFLVAWIMNRVSSTLSAAFSPMCYIPGLYRTPMCKWTKRMAQHGSDGKRGVMWADYPALVDVQSRTFEQLIDESVGSASLSLDMKKTEIATADLVALVRLSDLASKESLANTLSEFIHNAKNTGRSLHRLESKLNGAIDSIMAMNDFALHAIEGARLKAGSTMGALTIWKPKKPVEEVVKETFADAMLVNSEHLARLILELEANYENLQNLEEKLDTLRDIVARENKTVGAAKEELLENLWTMLGGNRKDLRNFDKNLKMLQDLTTHRKHASAHVVATLHTLQGMSQEMEDMRERVAAPNLAGSTIAPEVHIKSIKNGLERLREGRSRARKIEEAALRRALGANEDLE